MSLSSANDASIATSPPLDWSELRRHQRHRMVFNLSFVPVGVVLGIIAFMLFGNAAYAFPLVAAMLVVDVWIRVRLSKLKCPRCGQPFFRSAVYYNTWARRCLNCGVRRWTTEQHQPPP